MFFPKTFAPDVWLTFLDLDIPVQEAVLDVLEDVTANPAKLRFPSGPVGFYEAEAVLPAGRYVIFLELLQGDPAVPFLVNSLGVVKC